jgi:hypothetical protein
MLMNLGGYQDQNLHLVGVVVLLLLLLLQVLLLLLLLLVRRRHRKTVGESVLFYPLGR